MWRPIGNWPVGLEIGDHTVRAAQVLGDGGAVTVRALCSESFEPDPDTEDVDQDALAGAIDRIRRRRVFSGRRVALTLPPRELAYAPLDVACANPEDLESAILEEAAKSVPYPLRDAVLDYPSVDFYHPDNDGVLSLREFATYAVICRQCELANCVEACPKEALEQQPDGTLKRYNLRCIACRSC